MMPRLRLCAFLAVLLAVASPGRGQQNPYRLKDLDQKKLCVGCHTDFEQKLKSRYVHTPVKTGDCTGCHEAHVSSHPKLLSDSVGAVCAQCHGDVAPANAVSVHKVVADGDCQKCHDPHGSDNPGNLVASGSQLCFGCHKDVADEVKTAKFRHPPLEQGCLTCHGPHGSDKAASLLTTAVPALCIGCHKPDTPSFTARHMKYPVAKANCTSCHDPHGSSQPALLWNTVHAPLNTVGCTACHQPPDSPAPFATKSPGYELCKGCHADAVNAMFASRRLHWPVADRKGCVNCHNPHASKNAKLVKAPNPQLCGACHSDTLKRIAAVPVKHAPVDGGSCESCHSPHGSNGIYLINPPSVNALCTTCHDYQTHSAHPIGEKAVDPRNKNLHVDCLSCHKAHGTPFKRMLLAETNVELCTRCHKQFGR
jgi:predicted CXXCH cytochrome family protein